jgi:hypothetical protein
VELAIIGPDAGGIATHDAAARHGDPAGHDEFAAALDPGRQLIDLRLEPHDLVAMVAVVHGGRPEALQDIGQPAASINVSGRRRWSMQ